MEVDMLGFLKSFQKRRRAINEVDSIEPNVLDDFGLNRSQFRRLALTPASVMRRMVAMAERHGVRPATFQIDSRERAIFAERCAKCRKTRECGAYLADQNAAIDQAGFCPNHTDFKWYARAGPRID
tara:strand:+ start:162 stop:539 length:378 start_codon:yes stop_codon:yes gene_type:complete